MSGFRVQRIHTDGFSCSCVEIYEEEDTCHMRRRIHVIQMDAHAHALRSSYTCVCMCVYVCVCMCVYVCVCARTCVCWSIAWLYMNKYVLSLLSRSLLYVSRSLLYAIHVQICTLSP